jgi:hypothetical protein
MLSAGQVYPRTTSTGVFLRRQQQHRLHHIELRVYDSLLPFCTYGRVFHCRFVKFNVPEGFVGCSDKPIKGAGMPE